MQGIKYIWDVKCTLRPAVGVWALKQLCSHLHKITNEPVFYMALAPYEFAVGQKTLLGQLEGAGPSNCPSNVFAPHQNHNGLRHIINGFINSY